MVGATYMRLNWAHNVQEDRLGTSSCKSDRSVSRSWHIPEFNSNYALCGNAEYEEIEQMPETRSTDLPSDGFAMPREPNQSPVYK